MKKIAVIGGVNVDVTSHPNGQLISGQKNPGAITMVLGGSGWNIAANLARLGQNVSFIARTGDDFPGRYARRTLEDLGVDVRNMMLDRDGNTPAYMEVLNLMDALELSFGDDSVLARLDAAQLDRAGEAITGADLVSVDANLSKDSMEHLLEMTTGVPLFLDPAGDSRAKALRDRIGCFTMIAPNRKEAEELSGLSILSGDELMTAGQWFLDQGVQRVFITMAGGGVYYAEGKQSGILRPEEGIPVVNKNGAGDAFSAAVLAAWADGDPVEVAAKKGMKAAALTCAVKEETTDALSPAALR